MDLNQKVETRDPLLILHDESGQFHVTGPSGQKELWQCHANGSVVSVKFLETVRPRGANTYLIEKIATEIGGEHERSRAASA